MMNTYVLDSYALLAFFEGESGASAIRKLLLSAEKGEAKLLMSVINLGEVWYIMARASNRETAEQNIGEIRSMAIEVVDANWEVTRQAASFKARGGMAYADCFAAAVAQKMDASLVTGDREFEQLSGVIKIKWV
jgi:ribonuclease VapC